MDLRAVATPQQQDDVTGFPLLRMVHRFLTIDEVMPPARLRWSRILNRPMLDRIHLTGDSDSLGPVFAEEVSGRECLVSYRHLNAGRHETRNNVPAGIMGRDTFWYVRIVDPEFLDLDFEFAWRGRYGLPWPMVDRTSPHPALRRLYDRFGAFYDDWILHGQNRDDRRPFTGWLLEGPGLDPPMTDSDED
jgi:hypothetical protein